MADFDFADIAARYLKKRMDPINQLIDDPEQYLQNRAEQGLGVSFNNTSTTAPVQMPELASQKAMAPADYSLNAPQRNAYGLPQQGPVAPVAVTSPVANPEITTTELPELPQGFNQLRNGNGPTEIPAGPVSPEVAVQPRPAARPATPAELIAQQESGRNPNIGYHYQPNEQGQRASTAYGKYGITAPAYADIQKAAPEFAGRPITSLSQEEQDRAFQIDRANRSKQLQAFGIEPTDANLAAAHLAGAKGLSDYLNNGYISPQAAAANGGADKFKKILDQRLGGGTAPASAAAQQQGAVAPSTWQGQTNEFGGMEEKPQAFTGQGLSVGGMNQAHLEALNSKDPKSLFKLAYDPTTSPAIQKMALDNLYNDTNTRKRMSDAEATVDKRLADGDVNGLTKDMNKKGEEGSYLKAILFKRLGLDSLAQQEMEKISPTLTATTLQYNDQNYVAQYDKNGNLRSAVNAETGEKADSSTLLKMAGGSGAMMGFKVASTRQDLENGHTVSILHNDKTGQIRYRDDVTGKVTDKAPPHMGNVGTKSPEALIHDKATMSANSAMKPMIDANTRAATAGGAPRFTEEQIQAAGAQAYKRINPTGQFGGAYTPGERPAAPTGGEAPATNAPTNAAAANAPAATNAPAAGAPKSYAQQVLDGEAAPPSGQSGQRAAVMEQVARLAAEQKKTYDPNLFNMRKKTEESFTTGKQGDTVRAMNVAIDHLDTLGDASKALKNGQYPVFNKLANLYATNTGQTAPGNFDALKSIVGSEVAKAVAGGATALGDREEIRKEISNAKNPEQLAGIIDKYQRLLGGQMSGLETQYKSGGGKNWDAKINDRTNEVMTKIHGGGKPQAVPAPYSDADKEARYQEFLKKRNAGKQ